MGKTIFRYIISIIFICWLISGCTMDADSNDPGNPGNTGPWFDSQGELGTLVITSPSSSDFSAPGSFTVEGYIRNNYYNYSFAVVWKDSNPKDYYFYFIQGDPVTGAFSQDIHLRYGNEGDGKYTVKFAYVDRAKISLNGKGAVYSIGGIYSTAGFRVTSTETGAADAWTLLPSYEIPITGEIISLKDKILSDKNVSNGSDEDKIRAINKWIVLNISYDYDSIIDGRRKKQDSLSVLHNKLAVCEGYANLTASLARSAGIQTRYVLSKPMNHAWVQVFIDGEWKMLDTTWNDPRFYGYPDSTPNDITIANWDSFTKYTEAYFLLPGVNGKDDHNGGEWTNSRTVLGFPAGMGDGYSFIERWYND